MYHYGVDKELIFTPEDLHLYRESPFSSWMERLSLEKPSHGILPDFTGKPEPRDPVCMQIFQQTAVESVLWGDFVFPKNTAPGQPGQSVTITTKAIATEGIEVVEIAPQMEEPWRRSETLKAMSGGAEFIVNGQLAQGSMSGPVDLLVRSNGVSNFGNYIYLPCDTRQKKATDCAFRLCFSADLLSELQGTLPPQLLVFDSGMDMVPLLTDDYIYHYWAVKSRFQAAQTAFSKHRMPDPVESSHFGRWSSYAHEVLKRRALRLEKQPVADALDTVCDLAAARYADEAISVEEKAEKSIKTLSDRLLQAMNNTVPVKGGTKSRGETKSILDRDDDAQNEENSIGRPDASLMTSDGMDH